MERDVINVFTNEVKIYEKMICCSISKLNLRQEDILQASGKPMESLTTTVLPKF